MAGAVGLLNNQKTGELFSSLAQVRVGEDVLDNDFLLTDRITKIQSVIKKYGEENFYISFSGGKDSTVLHHLVDMAVPGNSIPRVYADTGIELKVIRDFVLKLKSDDDRFVMIKPSVPIKKMLAEDGYPFKSKEHSEYVDIYQRNGITKTADRYLHPAKERETFGCPKKLRYQFTDECSLRISDKCCFRMKEEPLARWQKENEKRYAIVGIMRDEGGRRNRAKCLAFSSSGTLERFQPLSVMSKEWEDWFIKEYHIELSNAYTKYGFKRTGCKGCPFNPNLQDDLDMLSDYFPAERKQCEDIWKPVYDEYRRIGFRLRSTSPEEEGRQMSIFDYISQ